MQTVKLRDEYIKLGQALKAAGLVQTGADAKMFILDGQVFVNGQKELRRGNKLREGDVISFHGEEIKIIK